MDIETSIQQLAYSSWTANNRPMFFLDYLFFIAGQFISVYVINLSAINAVIKFTIKLTSVFI